MSWSTIPDMPTARQFLSATADPSGNIYTVGGFRDGGQKAFEKWDGSSWTSLPDVPGGIKEGGAVADGQGRIYAVSRNNFQIFFNGSWNGFASIPRPRRNLDAAGGKDGIIYATGGRFKTDPKFGFGEVVESPRVDKWTGTEWVNIPDMPTGRYRHAATADSANNIYVTGGVESFRSGDPTKTFFKWDGSSWTTLPDMPVAIDGHGASTDGNDNVYVAGTDFDGNGVLIKWDGSAWSNLNATPPTEPDNTSVAGTGNAVYMLGGRDSANARDTANAQVFSLLSPPSAPTGLTATV